MIDNARERAFGPAEGVAGAYFCSSAIGAGCAMAAPSGARDHLGGLVGRGRGAGGRRLCRHSGSFPVGDASLAAALADLGLAAPGTAPDPVPWAERWRSWPALAAVHLMAHGDSLAQAKPV